MSTDTQGCINSALREEIHYSLHLHIVCSYLLLKIV